MQELQVIVNAKMKAMSEDGTIQKAIEDGIESAIVKAISSQFQSYGNLTKQIEKALDEGLGINTKDLDFESYNEQMLVAVKTKMGEHFKSEASSRFMDEMDKLLKPAPKEMTINELVETVAGFWKTDEPWDASDLDDYATVELDRGEGCLDKTWSLAMWKQKESSSTYSSSKRSADLNLFISHDQIRISHNQSYNLTCFSEHEAFIFKLYAAGTVLTGLEDFEPDDCELTLKESEY